MTHCVKFSAALSVLALVVHSFAGEAPSARAVVDKAIQAVGGMDKLQKYKIR